MFSSCNLNFHEEKITKLIFTKKEFYQRNPNFYGTAVGAFTNQGKWNVKFDIRVYLYQSINKIGLKFCLTMEINRNRKEVTLKTKYEALK